MNFKSEFEAFKNDFAKISGFTKDGVLFQTWDQYFDAYCKFNANLVQFFQQKYVEYGNEQTLCWYLVYNSEKYEMWKSLEKFIAFVFPSPWFWGFGDEMVLFESTAKYIYEQEPERFCATLKCMIHNFGMFLIDFFEQLKKGLKLGEMDEETKNKAFDNMIGEIKTSDDVKIQEILERKENIINGIACAIASLRYFGEMELANMFYMFFKEKIKSKLIKTEAQKGLIDLANKFKTAKFIKELNLSMKICEKEQLKDD